MRLFSIYKHLICVLVDVCCEKGVHIFLVSKSQEIYYNTLFFTFQTCAVSFCL